MSKQSMFTISFLGALCAMAVFSMQAKAAQQDDAERQEGMVVVRDAQTGKMRAPTTDELKALRGKRPGAAAATTGAAQPQALTGRRPGTHGVRLGEKNMVYEVVSRGPDGKLTSECVQGEAAAEQALHGAIQGPADHKEHDHETR
jgi:hypothetical protein